MTAEQDVLSAQRLLAAMPPPCERCEGYGYDVSLRAAATAYGDERRNAPLLLCNACADEYYEYWDEMWREYNAGRG